jgi:hypothetical protein
MTTPLDRANKKRTFWKAVGSTVIGIVGIAIAVAKKGKIKLNKS